MKITKALLFSALFFLFCSVSVIAEDVLKYNLCIPVVMYHQISDDSTGDNEYIISTSQLTNDFNEYKKAGFTPIKISEFLMMRDSYLEIAISETDKEKEEKIKNFENLIKKYQNPILLTFDDGYADGLHILLPKLKEYGFKANIAVVGKYSDKGEKFLTWDEIKTMHDSGYIEFGNHTYQLHDYPYSQYRAFCNDFINKETISSDYKTNETRILNATGALPAYFAYPFGISSQVTETVLDEMGVRVSLVTSLTSDFAKLGDSTRKISRINRTPAFNSAEFVKLLINKVKKTSPGAYENFGKSLSEYIGDKIETPPVKPKKEPVLKLQQKEVYNILICYKTEKYQLEGVMENGSVVIDKKEISKIHDASFENINGDNLSVINIFDKKLILCKNSAFILEENGVKKINILSENGKILIRNFFESVNCDVLFNGSRDTVLIKKANSFFLPFM